MCIILTRNVCRRVAKMVRTGSTRWLGFDPRIHGLIRSSEHHWRFALAAICKLLFVHRRARHFVSSELACLSRSRCLASAQPVSCYLTGLFHNHHAASRW